MDLMPFDELNRLEASLPIYFEDGKIRSQKDYEDILDELLDLFLLSYAQGVESANIDLASDQKRTLDEATNVVNDAVAGKTWRERMREHYESGGTIADVIRIAETESHRDYTTGAFDAAKAAGAKFKTWHTMMDDKVRDTHQYLEGVTIPIDDEFHSYMGGSTQAPGMWGIPEEDVNCRCWLTFS